jgi:hypothetical protein
MCREKCGHTIPGMSHAFHDYDPARVAASYSRIEAAPQRVVMCHLMIDVMRTIHLTYAPANESFGSRLETAFIGMCVALGDMEGKPFSITKITEYLHIPRATVIRRLHDLHHWGLVNREGHRYYSDDKLLNSLMGMRCYKRVRQMMSKAAEELYNLDTGSTRIRGASAWRRAGVHAAR